MTTNGARVDLAAGLWGVALVVLIALILLTALRPVLRRRTPEVPVPCCEPGSLGSHPLEVPDEDGVRRCPCGMVSSTFPAQLRLVSRTDTRELHLPAAGQPLMPATSLGLAKATGHPSVWEPPDDEAPTGELPRPYLVWRHRR